MMAKELAPPKPYPIAIGDTLSRGEIVLVRYWNGSEEASNKLASGRVVAIGSDRTPTGSFRKTYVIDRGREGRLYARTFYRLKNGSPVCYLPGCEA